MATRLAEAKSEAPVKFRIQDAQYGFPYHYVPTLERGHFRQHFLLRWGYEYLGYLNYCLDRLGELEWKTLLDVGCGDGRLISMASERFGDKKLVGIDASEQAIGLAHLLAGGGEFVADDITRPGVFPQPFDALTCVEVIEHIPPPALPGFVEGMRRQVKQGGKLIVTVPSTNRPVSAKHYQHFDPALLQAALEPHFRPERLLYLNGTGWRLRQMKRLFINRLFLVTNQRALDAFYRLYVRRYLVADARSGGRVFGLFTAV
jgi:2-polyprenyl-3-methyl-5-hydroxy-6-metoxy-1,4-benzoquinol methylase